MIPKMHSISLSRTSVTTLDRIRDLTQEIDPNDLQELMRAYTSKESDWRQYALYDPSRNYTRNLVDEGNGKSNLVGWLACQRPPGADVHSWLSCGHLEKRVRYTIMPMRIVS
jgi:hypothetical protein